VVRVQAVENHCSKPYVERTVEFYTLPAFKNIFLRGEFWQRWVVRGTMMLKIIISYGVIKLNSYAL
jgi:hypothetical protein